jgi:dihydrofolate reductase
MGRLIYSMITSLDGYTEATDGDIGFGAADDEEVHSFVEETFRSVGTYLYGRRMYETMVFWETAHELPDAPPYIVQYARHWQAAEKVVYSTTLETVSSERTRIERSFDAGAVARFKSESSSDLTVDGPTLAAQAIAADLVDEFHPFMTTTVVGAGRRFFPEGIRLDLELLEERSFASGLIYARYRKRGSSDR